MRYQVEPQLSENDRIQALCVALAASAGDRDLILRFLRDLLSARELQDVANRWAAARMLMDGQTQVATARELSLSAKTVNEIAAWVNGTFATGGYWDVQARVTAPAGS